MTLSFPFLREKLYDIDEGVRWDVKFPDAPSPLNDFIPAKDVRENIATLQSIDQSYSIGNIQVPGKTTVFDVTITFYESDFYIIEDWFDEWVNSEILSDGTGILPIGEAVRRLEIYKYNRQWKLIKAKSYLVYPEVELYFEGKEQAQLTEIEVKFIVAGSLTSTSSVK